MTEDTDLNSKGIIYYDVSDFSNILFKYEARTYHDWFEATAVAERP